MENGALFFGNVAVPVRYVRLTIAAWENTLGNWIKKNRRKNLGINRWTSRFSNANRLPRRIDLLLRRMRFCLWLGAYKISAVGFWLEVRKSRVYPTLNMSLASAKEVGPLIFTAYRNGLIFLFFCFFVGYFRLSTRGHNRLPKSSQNYCILEYMEDPSQLRSHAMQLIPLSKNMLDRDRIWLYFPKRCAKEGFTIKIEHFVRVIGLQFIVSIYKDLGWRDGLGTISFFPSIDLIPLKLNHPMSRFSQKRSKLIVFDFCIGVSATESTYTEAYYVNDSHTAVISHYMARMYFNVKM